MIQQPSETVPKCGGKERKGKGLGVGWEACPHNGHSPFTYKKGRAEVWNSRGTEWDKAKVTYKLDR